MEFDDEIVMSVQNKTKQKNPVALTFRELRIGCIIQWQVCQIYWLKTNSYETLKKRTKIISGDDHQALARHIGFIPSQGSTLTS